MVEGEPGDALAGWARLRKQRHHARGLVRVRTDDGVVELEVPGSCLLGPIETVKGDWQELEPHPAAQLCITEAPAPDEHASISYTIVRGGDAIVAAGVVLTEQLVTEDDGGLRAGARSRVTRLSSHFIGIGPDAADIVTRLRREADEDKREKAAAEAKQAEKAASTKAAGMKPAVSLVVPSAKRALREYRISRRNAVLGVAAAIVIASVGTLLAHSPVPLMFAAVALALPLVVDELVLPDLHPFGQRAKTFPAVAAGTVYFVAAALVPTIGWAYVFERGGATRASQIVIGMVVVGGIAIVTALLTWRLDRGRRRILARIADAPPHPSPLTDSVWGATDGVVDVDTKGAFDIEGRRVAAGVGQHTTFSGSGKHTSMREAKFQGAANSITINGTTVKTAGGWWLSLEVVADPSGERRSTSAEVIHDGASARVVGRAKANTLVAGGPHTLLVFAAPVGSEIAGALAELRTRLQTNLVLALVGAAAFIALAVYGTSL